MLKGMIFDYRKVDTYTNARRMGSRLKIEEFVNTLRGQEENRFEQVFGEKATLLEGFLEAAAERRRNGIVENPRKPRTNRKKKRAREEDNLLEADEQPGWKRACVARKMPSIFSLRTCLSLRLR